MRGIFLMTNALMIKYIRANEIYEQWLRLSNNNVYVTNLDNVGKRKLQTELRKAKQQRDKLYEKIYGQLS